MTDQELIRSVIQRIAVGPDRGRDVSFDEAYQTMRAILGGHVDEVQTAVILIALRMKRESIDEMRGIIAALSVDLAVTPINVPDLFCLADPFDGYVRHHTMTPFLPSVLAALDMPTSMIGVAEVGPKFGVTAEQVYALAGINVNANPEKSAELIAGHGWGYLSQRIYAPSLYALQELRARIVKRSALTTLERLLNPLRGRSNHAVLGYVHKAYPEIYASAAQQVGFDTALLTKGVEGGLAPASNKPLRQYRVQLQGAEPALTREKVDLPESLESQAAAVTLDNDETTSAVQVLTMGMAVLSGRSGQRLDQARRSLVLAAAHVIWAYRPTLTLSEAVEKVQDCLDNGSALKKFNALRAP